MFPSLRLLATWLAGSTLLFGLTASATSTYVGSLPAAIHTSGLKPHASMLWRSQPGTLSLGELLARMENEEQFGAGLYVPGVLALPIIQQPEDNSLYVSNKGDRVTQFREAAENGITAILAHNFLAGGAFYDISLGQDIWVVRDAGIIEHYQVTSIQQFQRLQHGAAEDEFIALDTRESLDTGEIFAEFYEGKPRLTLQTCLEKNGDSDWGLTFIVADLIP